MRKTPTPPTVEETARDILARLYNLQDLTTEQLHAAMDQVRADPEGSHALTLDWFPMHRPELRLARSKGWYLGQGNAPTITSPPLTQG